MAQTSGMFPQVSDNVRKSLKAQLMPSTARSAKRSAKSSQKPKKDPTEGSRRDRAEDQKLKSIPKGPVGKFKIKKVMGEFGSGKLKSSGGEPVTDVRQARAIAFSEARKAVAGGYGNLKGTRALARKKAGRG